MRIRKMKGYKQRDFGREMNSQPGTEKIIEKESITEVHTRHIRNVIKEMKDNKKLSNNPKRKKYLSACITFLQGQLIVVKRVENYDPQKAMEGLKGIQERYGVKN